MAPTVQRFSQTNKVASLTDGATISIDCNVVDIGVLNTLSQTSVFANPTGTPTDGQLLTIRLTSAVVRAISFGSNYQATSGKTLPTVTTGGGAEDYIWLSYNANDSKWDLTSTTIASSASTGISEELAIAYAIAL